MREEPKPSASALNVPTSSYKASGLIRIQDGVFNSTKEVGIAGLVCNTHIGSGNMLPDIALGC